MRKISKHIANPVPSVNTQCTQVKPVVRNVMLGKNPTQARQDVPIAILIHIKMKMLKDHARTVPLDKHLQQQVRLKSAQGVLLADTLPTIRNVPPVLLVHTAT